MDEIYIKLKFSESGRWDEWSGRRSMVCYLYSDLVALLRRLLGYNMKRCTGCGDSPMLFGKHSPESCQWYN